MRPYVTGGFGNPSSTHPLGVRTRQAVEAARRQVAGAIDALAEEIVFTSGGTESNNHAIRGVVSALRDRGNHVITSAIGRMPTKAAPTATPAMASSAMGVSRTRHSPNSWMSPWVTLYGPW